MELLDFLTEEPQPPQQIGLPSGPLQQSNEVPVPTAGPFQPIKNRGPT